MKSTLIAVFIVLMACSCKGQPGKGGIYGTNYLIGQIPNKEAFLQLTEDEKNTEASFNSFDKAMDSLAQHDDKLKGIFLWQKRDFIKNRSIVFMQHYVNGKITKVDSTERLSALCECLVSLDSLFVTSDLGFERFKINVVENDFQSGYFLYTKVAKPYKLHINDNFTYSLTVDNKYQSLTLDKKPSLKEGQQLTGYLEMTSDIYYENTDGDRPGTNYVKAKVYFTCTTKEKLLLAK